MILLKIAVMILPINVQEVLGGGISIIVLKSSFIPATNRCKGNHSQRAAMGFTQDDQFYLQFVIYYFELKTSVAYVLCLHKYYRLS